MENELVAPVAGAVERVFVGAGDAVERGAPLVEIR
jgi:biotin carboxyl carrier protein